MSESSQTKLLPCPIYVGTNFQDVLNSKKLRNFKRKFKHKSSKEK